MKNRDANLASLFSVGVVGVRYYQIGAKKSGCI